MEKSSCLHLLRLRKKKKIWALIWIFSEAIYENYRDCLAVNENSQNDELRRKESHRSLSSLIRSNFFSTSCSGSSSSSLKVFYKTPADLKKYFWLQIKKKHYQRCLISCACKLPHTSWVPTHSARDTTRRRSFVLGPLRAFSASTNDERTSSRCSLYFLSEIALFFTEEKIYTLFMQDKVYKVAASHFFASEYSLSFDIKVELISLSTILDCRIFKMI